MSTHNGVRLLVKFLLKRSYFDKWCVLVQNVAGLIQILSETE